MRYTQNLNSTVITKSLQTPWRPQFVMVINLNPVALYIKHGALEIPDEQDFDLAVPKLSIGTLPVDTDTFGLRLGPTGTLPGDLTGQTKVIFITGEDVPQFSSIALDTVAIAGTVTATVPAGIAITNTPGVLVNNTPGVFKQQTSGQFWPMGLYGPLAAAASINQGPVDLNLLGGITFTLRAPVGNPGPLNFDWYISADNITYYFVGRFVVQPNQTQILNLPKLDRYSLLTVNNPNASNCTWWSSARGSTDSIMDVRSDVLVGAPTQFLDPSAGVISNTPNVAITNQPTTIKAQPGGQFWNVGNFGPINPNTSINQGPVDLAGYGGITFTYGGVSSALNLNWYVSPDNITYYLMGTIVVSPGQTVVMNLPKVDRYAQIQVNNPLGGGATNWTSSARGTSDSIIDVRASVLTGDPGAFADSNQTKVTNANINTTSTILLPSGLLANITNAAWAISNLGPYDLQNYGGMYLYFKNTTAAGTFAMTLDWYSSPDAITSFLIKRLATVALGTGVLVKIPRIERYAIVQVGNGGGASATPLMQYGAHAIQDTDFSLQTI